MNEYLHENGFTYTENELARHARREGMSLDEYIKSKPLTLVTGKETGSTVDPTVGQESMGSQLDDGSLEPKEELSDSEQFRNVFKNAKLSLQEAWESSKIAGAQFSSYLGIGDEEETDKYIVDQYKKLDEISAKMGDTGKGIVRGIKEGDITDIGIGVVNALTSVITTVAPAIATRGVSLVPQIMAPMYTEYNSEKAKALYGDDEERAIEKLIANNEDEVAVPMALGVASVALERIGVKGISSYVLNNAKTKGAKRIADLTLTGNREGLTEYFQGGLNVANKSLAQGDDAGTVSKKVFDHMSSEAALEEYVQGFVGGAGVSAGGRKINSAFRDKNDNIIVNDYINALGALNQQKVNSKTQDAKSVVDKKIKKVEQQFKDFLITNQKKSEYLTEEQAAEAISILDTKNELNTKLQDIGSQLKNGEINKNEHDLILEDIKNQFETNNKKLNDIKVEANKKLLHDDLRVSSEAISKIRGLSQKVYKTPEGFLKALNARSKKQYKLKDIENVDGLVVGKDILINETVAAETNAITVGSHELLHAIVKSSITGETRKVKDVDGKTVETDLTVEGTALIKDFLNELSSKEKKIVQKRIDDNYRYNKDGSEKAFEQYAEEYLNAYADAAIKNELNDSVLDKLAKFLQKIFNTGKSGYQDLNFKTGEDVKTFLKAYVSDRKKGQFRQQFIDMAQEGVKQKTKTTIIKESRSKPLEEINKLIPDNVKTQEDYYKLLDDPRVTNRILDTKGKLAPVIEAYIRSRSTSTDIARENIQAVKDRLVNFDPSAKRADGTIVGPEGFGEFIFANARFGKMVAEKKLAIKAAETKRTTRIDDPDVKDIADDTPTPTTEIEDKTKARELKDFNVELDNGLADALTIEEVNSLLDSYAAGKITFKQAKAKMEELVAKDIRSELSKSIPKITKDKKTGKRGPTPEYESWIRDQYDEVVQSLGMETIRKAYRPWFQKKKIRTEKYKGISPKTGKVTNYVKDVFENTTNKREYIRWFLEGKPGSLTERRTALIRRIAKRKASLAVDNYIAENSNIDGQILAKIKMLSDSANNAKSEQVSFDSVKFSMNQSFANKIENMVLNEYYSNVSKKIKRKDKNGKNLYADMGRAFEKVVIDILENMGIPRDAIRVTVDGPTEKGGLADVTLEVYGKPVNLELKFGENVAMGSVLVKTLDFVTGKYSLAKDENYSSIDFKSLMKRGLKPVKNLVDTYNSYIEDYNNGVKEVVLKDGTVLPLNKKGIVLKGKDKEPFITKIGSPMLVPIQKILQKRGLTSFGVDVISKDGQPLADHYLAKTTVKEKQRVESPVEYIEIFPRGLYTFLENPLLKGAKNIIDVARIKTSLYLKNSGSIKDSNKKPILNKAGDKKIRFQLQFQNSLVELKEDSDVSMTNEQDVKSMLGMFSKSIVSTKTLSNAIKMSRSAFDKFQLQKQRGKEFVESIRPQLKQSRGITVLDFDDTLATTKSLVRFTAPDGTTGTLNAEEYASTYQDLLEQGYTFDFSEFNKVVKGKIAPLFQKALKLQGKFGPENMFVLTARPPAAQKAIFDFLKANGLNIPLKNITGLGNSTSEAKALWIADKVGEGYNDFYFADDALQNVQAVKNMLDQFDVKSKVQQAKVKFSKSMDKDFNNILENVTGIDAKKRFSETKARKRGADKGKFRFFIPPSHEDFVGLLYNFMGKGKEGNKHRDFFEQALVRPLNRAYREIDTAKQAIANDYKSLNKQFPDVKNKLVKNTPDSDFTFQDAIRVYLWNKHGYTIPGLSKTDQANLVEIVMNDVDLLSYAEAINTISRQDTYVDPGQNWETGNIRIDLVDATGRVGRAEYFTEFNENVDIIFSPENLNKIEAAYGASFRSALEDMLYRIKTGINRPKGASAKPNMLLNWLNASVSGVMFFNTRSALLQQMSNVNYLNFADNNIYAAGKAFANQPQYWKDFAMIFNSDMLKQRRGGLQTDINGAELAEAIKKARPGNLFDQVAIITGKALRLGFLPTQIGDNIAIATGGAAFYRNRVNKYIKDGLSKKEAENKAFTDLQDITNTTQQSARPDMTSQQQAAVIGKIVLNFLNTPSQYNRIIKKAASDIINRRITPPNTTKMQSDMSNMSRILYYGAAQNLIFYSLQTALFAVMFGLDDEDEQKKAEQFLKKKERVINGSIDTILRGSGIYGVAVSTVKNMLIKFLEQRKKGYNKDESAVLMEALNFSPVVGIRARSIVNAEKTVNYNEKVIKEMETFDIDNPMWPAVTNYIQVTGLPANRIYQKTINLRNASDNDYEAWQRVLFFSGYTTWSLGLEDTKKMKDIKEKVKEKKKTTPRSRSRSRSRTRTRTR